MKQSRPKQLQILYTIQEHEPWRAALLPTDISGLKKSMEPSNNEPTQLVINNYVVYKLWLPNNEHWSYLGQEWFTPKKTDKDFQLAWHEVTYIANRGEEPMLVH